MIKGISIAECRALWMPPLSYQRSLLIYRDSVCECGVARAIDQGISQGPCRLVSKHYEDF